MGRLYTLREGDWSQIPTNIPAVFQQPLRGDVVRNALRQWVNTCDLNDMLQLLIEWKAFMEDVLMSGDHIQHAEQSKLSMYLQFYSVNVDLEKDATFPADVMLMHCVDAYKIAADQFSERNKVIT